MYWRWRLAQRSEIRWWRATMRRKNTEAFIRSKKEYWRRCLSEMELHPTYGQLGLEVGSGPVGIFTVLPMLTIDAVDPLMPEYAKHKDVFNKEHYPWVTFHGAALESFLLAHRYDWIFCINVLSQVEDMGITLLKLAKALKPGGTLLIGINTHKYEWIHHFLRNIPLDILHPNQYTRTEYTRMFESMGFEITRVKRIRKGFWFDHYQLTLTR